MKLAQYTSPIETSKEGSMSYVLYARKSTEDEGRQIQSIPDQLEVLNKHASQNRLRVVTKFTESKSAKKKGREEFNKMIRYLQSKKIKGILCWDLSRLSRNMIDSATIDELLQEGIVEEIVTPRRSYDKHSFVEYGVMSVLNTEYSRQLSENVKRALARKVRQGIAPHQPMPGYMYDSNKPEGQRDHVPHPEYFPIMQKMFRLFMTGNHTVKQIRDMSEDVGLKNHRGKPISRNRMHEVLKSPYYTGRFVTKGQLHQGIHFRMLSDDEFDLIQEIIGGRKPKKVKKHFVLNSFVKCGVCGLSIYGEQHVKKYKNGNSQTFKYYRCSKKKGVCDLPHFRAEELEQQVSDFLGTIEVSDKFVDWASKWLMETRGTFSKQADATQDVLNKELKKVREQMDNTMDFESRYGKKLDIVEETQDRIRRLKLQRQRLLDQLDQLNKKDDNSVDLTIATLKFARDAKKLYDSGSLEDKRRIIKGVQDSNLVLKKDRLEIKPRTPFLILKGKIDTKLSTKGFHDPKVMPYLWVKHPPKGQVRGRRDSIRTLEKLVKLNDYWAKSDYYYLPSLRLS